jgi:hypothetical protein
MNTLKRVFIVLVSVVFLAAVSIGGAQAGTTVKGGKSNSDNIAPSPSGTGASSQSNVSPGKGPKVTDPTTDSISLNSSRSNIYRQAAPKKKNP